MCIRKPKLGPAFKTRATAKNATDPVCGLEVSTGGGQEGRPNQ